MEGDGSLHHARISRVRVGSQKSMSPSSPQQSLEGIELGILTQTSEEQSCVIPHKSLRAMYAFPLTTSGLPLAAPSHLAPAPNPIAMISTTNAHTVILDESGQVSWLSNRQWHDMSALASHVVRYVCTGHDHCLALTKQGLVFLWGRHMRDTTHGANVPHTDPWLVNEGMAPAHRVTAGNGFSVLIDGEGRVYTFGRGDNGRLGHGDVASHSRPTLVEALRETPIAEVACGSMHTLFLGKDGKLRACGRNGAGQLGTKLIMNMMTPVEIELPLSDPVIGIASGSLHSVVWTQHNTWSFGHNNYGSLGTGHFEDVYGPQLVALPTGTVLESVSCGAYHTVCMTSSGTMWIWGRLPDRNISAPERLAVVAVDEAGSEEEVPNVGCVCGGGRVIVMLGRLPFDQRNATLQWCQGGVKASTPISPLQLPTREFSEAS